jgi:hypothetical protein
MCHIRECQVQRPALAVPVQSRYKHRQRRWVQVVSCAVVVPILNETTSARSPYLCKSYKLAVADTERS